MTASPITHTYVYTTPGPQRPVLLPEGKVCRFSLTLLEGDSGYVETTCDPLSSTHPLWERFEGGLAGGVAHVTALRVVMQKMTGWAELRVQQEERNHG
jgi:hypothetical protein